MKGCDEGDDWAPVLRSKLFFRSEAEAAWLKDSAGGNPGHAYPLSSLSEERERRIREVAYFKAERRGFAPGHELEDWLEAEQEVDTASQPPPRR
ncbi:MAG: DUF2934 domain-containing protein [Chromatiaceae bacterium]|jgi:hypothetical protein